MFSTTKVVALMVLLSIASPFTAGAPTSVHDPAKLSEMSHIIQTIHLENYLKMHLERHLVNSSDMCKACEACMHEFQVDLQLAEPIVDSLLNVTAELCKLIGGKPVVRECLYVVGELRKDYHWVADVATPFMLCQDLRLCNTTLTI